MPTSKMSQHGAERRADHPTRSFIRRQRHRRCLTADFSFSRNSDEPSQPCALAQARDNWAPDVRLALGAVLGRR